MPSNFEDVIAVILAGGYGTRIKHLLPDIPKPMAMVAGKPFLEWVVYYLKTQGITKVILSTGYLSEVIKGHFQSHPVNGVEIICCQETKPSGTAGGFLNVVNQSQEKPSAWLVMNGDSLIFTNLKPLTNYLLDDNLGGVIVGLSVADASRYGTLVCNQEGDLINFAEKCHGSGVVNAGVYLLRQNILKEFPKHSPLSFENDVFPVLLNKNIRLKVQIVDAPFLDIGTPESLPQADQFITANLAKFII